MSIAFIARALTLIAFSIAAPVVSAQPAERPVRIVVGFAPGGPTDIVARIFAPALARHLGQSVLVENRPGAAGAIGIDSVVKAAPDGTMLVLGSESDFAVGPVLFKKLPYDPAKDLTPVGGVASLFNVLVVNPAAGYRNLQDFIDRAKAAPGKTTYGSGGAASPSHLFGALFNVAAGVDLVHVPYKGAGLALTDLMGRHLDAMFVGGPAGVGPVRAGKLTALAVTGTARAAQLPNVPTFGEGGVKSPEFEQSFWWSLMGPPGLGAAQVARLAAALGTALREAEVQTQFANQGLAPRFDDAAAIRTQMARDREKWARVVQAAGITAD